MVFLLSLAGVLEMNDSIRKRLEEKEENLSIFASKVVNSKGRNVFEEPSPFRTDFQRDRDRIVHSKSFRRIKHKTQVFISPLGDHFVTRLTHTLEVSQIARTISRALNLNEDLTEAMSLGHDVGHTPFGHLGEELLSELSGENFRHNHQSLRLVEKIEKEGKGLNLTFEVREGIAHHSKPRGDFLDRQNIDSNLSLEAQVLRVSDAIAYLNHDLLDAFRAEVLTQDQLPQSTISILGVRHSQRINTMVSDIIEASLQTMINATRELPPIITMSSNIKNEMNLLREFMFENVYLPASQSEESEAAKSILILLFNYYKKFPEKIPMEYKAINESDQGAMMDYISGMTDNFAIRVAENISPGISNVFKNRIS